METFFNPMIKFNISNMEQIDVSFLLLWFSERNNTMSPKVAIWAKDV